VDVEIGLILYKAEGKRRRYWNVSSSADFQFHILLLSLDKHVEPPTLRNLSSLCDSRHT
jgi:hypothetical protein